MAGNGFRWLAMAFDGWRSLEMAGDPWRRLAMGEDGWLLLPDTHGALSVHDSRFPGRFFFSEGYSLLEKGYE